MNKKADFKFKPISLKDTGVDESKLPPLNIPPDKQRMLDGYLEYVGIKLRLDMLEEMYVRAPLHEKGRFVDEMVKHSRMLHEATLKMIY